MPEELLNALSQSDPRLLGAYMLDTGESDAADLEVFRRAMDGRASGAEVDHILRDAPPGWAKRCRRVIAEPEAVKADLISLLDQYHESVFMSEIPGIERTIAKGTEHAERLISVLRTSEAVDQLCGGYTLSEDLTLDRITLAASAFIYPFMSSRVDEATGTALIVFGVRGRDRDDEAVLFDDSLLEAMKALSDGARLRAMSLIRDRPMYGPEFVQLLGVTQPTMHHHLSLLRAAGLVHQERTHRGMLYTVRIESAESIIETLRGLLLPAHVVEDADGDGGPSRRTPTPSG
jgi:DNA-binding transcriptional ArsR family regulator